jgi:hypothetical protein
VEWRQLLRVGHGGDLPPVGSIRWPARSGARHPQVELCRNRVRPIRRTPPVLGQFLARRLARLPCEDQDIEAGISSETQVDPADSLEPMHVGATRGSRPAVRSSARPPGPSRFVKYRAMAQSTNPIRLRSKFPSSMIRGTTLQDC